MWPDPATLSFVLFCSLSPSPESTRTQRTLTKISTLGSLSYYQTQLYTVTRRVLHTSAENCGLRTDKDRRWKQSRVKSARQWKKKKGKKDSFTITQADKTCSLMIHSKELSRETDSFWQIKIKKEQTMHLKTAKAICRHLFWCYCQEKYHYYCQCQSGVF